ncbi:hypothetical protein [Streptomyces flaveus]|uniref:Uncharacterized protein n=1 Tax=Streptomyces flaveus TaxID=66370 RepID=A0A917QWF4_9ACTN|nr:hypothetical protein [Streptomyces flaveus]GGK73288.1 hypothetical protein GCM10010094_37950 [Streptomyces flaveus]
MLGCWVPPSGEEAQDKIRRRVLFPRELERHASGAGFEVMDMLNEPEVVHTALIACAVVDRVGAPP